MNGSPAVNDDARTPVNDDLSDLFFNIDIDDARVIEKGRFVGWNEERLREEAETLLGRLERLGVGGLPGPDELVRDFLGRV